MFNKLNQKKVCVGVDKRLKYTFGNYFFLILE